VTVLLLPDPPQTPPPVDEQLIKAIEDGRLSLTVTDCAAFGPLLVTVIVKVIFEPAIAGEGAAPLLIERSASPRKVRQLENSDVLPEGSVAVAVTKLPGGTAV
jgi:hypothetical protein